MLGLIPQPNLRFSLSQAYWVRGMEVRFSISREKLGRQGYQFNSPFLQKNRSKLTSERNFYVLILDASLVLLLTVLMLKNYKSGGKIT